MTTRSIKKRTHSRFSKIEIPDLRMFIYLERLSGKNSLEIAWILRKKNTSTIFHHLKSINPNDVCFRIRLRKFNREKFLKENNLI